jgi:6-phosphogluconolactonase (cycloisomerase 2 family)
MSAKAMIGDRDRNCGLCVRGLVFSKDSRYLFVSRMRDGGVSVFDLAGKSGPLFMGTVFGMVSGPRDLEITNLDQSLMMSCNSSGYVGKADSRSIIERLGKSPGASIQAEDAGINVKKVFVGLGARSIRLSPDERHLFVSVNQTGELVAIDVDAMKIDARITVDSFPVGLDISPDGSQLWVTSQGRDAKGGNSVGIFQVRYRGEEAILKRTGSANAAAGE